MQKSKHIKYMQLAIDLAKKGIYTARPNPVVGAVIVKNNTVIAAGFHQYFGDNHAEINALNLAKTEAKAATIYVTLEPCSHTGKTAACSKALIDAGIATVVFGSEDPNPKVQGKGIAQLKAANIAVIGPVCDNQCRQLNGGFFKYQNRGLPFARLKMAMSLDARTAMADGNSFWITGSDARADVQLLRAQSCAVLSSAKSVISDNARLSFRPRQFELNKQCPVGQWTEVKQPLRVVLDYQNQLKSDSLFFKTAGKKLIFCNNKQINSNDTEFITDIEKFDLTGVLKYLGDNHCNEILIEAGATLSGAFVKAGLIDEMVVYLAPKIMGKTSKPLLDIAIADIDEALPFHIKNIRSVGRDIKITLMPELE